MANKPRRKPVKRGRVRVSFMLDVGTLDKLKRVAKKEDMKYQKLIRAMLHIATDGV